jgi:hypothetical protein
MNELLAYLAENCCGGNPCSPVAAVAFKTEAESI